MTLFVRLFSSTILLPIICISMIIAQISLENTDNSDQNEWKFNPTTFCIILFYVIQEFCIADVSFFNLHIVYFMYIIPITMILRNRNKIWWGLLTITPLLVIGINHYFHLYQFDNFAISLLQLASIMVMCAILIKFQQLSYYLKYTIALYFNALVYFAGLYCVGEVLTPDCVIIILIGTTFSILAEYYRMHREFTQNLRVAKLQYESVRDDLTGLLNFRAFDQEIKSLSNHKPDNNSYIGVIDIDHFKKLNDTHGHLNGNLVLSIFSKRLRADIHNMFDPDCAVYRFGGDEFSFVISTNNPDKIIDILSKIEKHYQIHPITISNGTKVTFSFSCGITRHLPNETYNHALERADSLVYKAKKTGRSKIISDFYLDEKDNPIH